MAAVLSIVFSTAIEGGNAQNLDEQKVLVQGSKDKSQLGEQNNINTTELILRRNEEFLISQRIPKEQKFIAQVWSNGNEQAFSLVPNQQKHQSSSFSPGNLWNAEELIIMPLNPQQQQIIAQAWSELNTRDLSLAEPIEEFKFIIPPEVIEEDSSPPKPVINPPSQQEEEFLTSQRIPEEQKFIAQVWSNGNEQAFSLVPNQQKHQSSGFSPGNLWNAEELIIMPLNPQQQQIIAQAWSELNTQDLSLAEPLKEFKFIVPSEILEEDSSPPKPLINPPSKQEIAARLALSKVRIIAPAPGVILDRSSGDRVTIQYPPTTSVQLKINGAELDESLVIQSDLDKKRNLIIKTWDGVKLQPGKNSLRVIASQHGIDTETAREVLVKDTNQVPVVEVETESAEDQNIAPEKKQSQDNSSPPQEQPVKILTPKANSILERIHSSVIIQYPQNASVILQVNGKSVDTAQVGRTETNSASGLVTQTWYGVIFPSGTSTLSVLATTDGVNYTETSIKVIVPGRPEAIQLETVEAEIPADGKSVTTVKGRFLDRHGTLTPWNDVVTLITTDGNFLGTDLEPDLPGFQVKSVKGKFTASLQASYNAKVVTILAKSKEIEAYTPIKFKTTLREKPLLTGFADLRIGARGTNYYDSFRDFLPTDENNDTEVDFTSAAFMIGSLGQWSYTGAFNSDRPLNEDGDGENRIFRTFSDKERGYPVYGDNSTTEATAPSIDHVYFRLERNPKIKFADPDYFMWGDYRTEEFNTESQEFSAISRQLHGFKANYNWGNFQLNALYANNIEGFQRDTIAPDGTSGFYFLSRRLLVPGSADIYLELSPLNDPGKIVRRQRLRLGADYDINYDRGTLLFNEPVLSTEIDNNGDILVRRIVATYQFESEAQDANLIAGRGRYHFNRNLKTPSWLGLTYLNEDGGDRDFQLWGIDGYVSLGAWGNLRAEYAESDNKTVFAEAAGSAYNLAGEINFSDRLRGRAYYRQVNDGFANDATLSFVPGQTRYGSEIQAQVGDRTELQLSYEHQDNKGVAPRPLDELEEFLELGTDPVPGNRQDNSLSTITAGIEQKIGKADLGVDLTWRDRIDRKSPGALTRSSTQLRSRLTMPLVENITFHALSDVTISDNTDTVFSDRLGLGLDWEFYDGLSLFLNHQWFTRGNFAGESLTNLGLQGEYEPWLNATLTGKYSIANGLDGVNNLGAMGLQQKIVLSPGLNLDLSYEHTFSGLNTTSSGAQFSQPFAVGQGASALSFGSGSSYGIGISYDDNPDFTANASWQYSDRSNGSNTVIAADVTGKLTSSLTSAIDYNQASSANQKLDIDTTRNLRVGLAYRHPQQDNFNALLRYEYEENGRNVPETLLLGKGTGSQKHLFGLEAIYAPDWRWELYGKYAFRHSKTFLADDFIGSSNVSLGQLRATYRLNYHMDLTAEGRMIWQPSANYTESGIVLEAGYYLTPELRLSAGYVFGNADDEDFTGTRSAGGPYLGVTVKLNSLFDGFGQHRPPAAPEGVSGKGGDGEVGEQGERRKQGKQGKQEKQGE